ncbi:hypothetical protein [Lysinibacillus sp. NPDC056232]|uniref:hypothetical protein n=1 Tax=Lysinibacillus sp. NPDC056232 TaxID=3345756 RepID=UPI0035E18894
MHQIYIPTTDDYKVKSIEVPIEDVLDTSLYATNPTNTSILSKDFATSKTTGKVLSIGQYVDLTKVIPAKSKVVSITIYCPTDTRVTQSQFTTIDNYLISYDGSPSSATVKFQKTDSPTSTSKTTFFKDKDANVKWFVQLEGTILKQQTGMDGFTVFGSKMIIEYK